jgi:hypothetical protein
MLELQKPCLLIKSLVFLSKALSYQKPCLIKALEILEYPVYKQLNLNTSKVQLMSLPEDQKREITTPTLEHCVANCRNFVLKAQYSFKVLIEICIKHNYKSLLPTFFYSPPWKYQKAIGFGWNSAIQ